MSQGIAVDEMRERNLLWSNLAENSRSISSTVRW